jgi:hypothetical protein
MFMPLGDNFPNSKQAISGQLGELKVKKWLDEHIVSYVDRTSFHESEDLVCFIPGIGRLRVQIKHNENNSWIIQKGGGTSKIRPVATWSRYTKDDIDAMILVHKNTFWAIPVEKITHRKEIHLTLKQAEEMFLKYKNNMSFYDCTEYNPVTVLTEWF